MYSDILALPPWVLTSAQALLGLAMILTAWRAWRGPAVIDRVVALDLFSALVMAEFVLLVFVSGFVSFLDVAAAIAIISFLATVAFARYLENREAEE